MVYHKILVIGNACSGKTTLSRFLSNKLQISVTHIDSIQFDQNLNIRPYKETIAILDQIIASKNQWIIDGFGPLDNLIQRFDQADRIILIDLPIWLNYVWAIKRQFRNIFFKARSELPAGADERSPSHTLKLFKTIHQIHTKMRPELLRILYREPYKNKTMILSSYKLYKSHFNTSKK